MESTSKLADLTLVSKYYPVANYSYPRSREYGQGRGSVDNTSIVSADIPPGLVEDRTDSETSADDDYQYHAHATELWDTFWQSEAEKKPLPPIPSPKKQYPALIPSPQQRKQQASQQASPQSPRHQAWPLPELPPHQKGKKVTATYSPFPKPMLLPARSSRPVPSWTSSRPGGMPQRPPRPDNDLLMPCVRESVLAPGARAALLRESHSQRTNEHRPMTPQVHRRPPPPEARRPTTSFESRRTMGLESNTSSICCASRSGASSPTHQEMRETRSVAPPPANIEIPQESEPQSVFECDDSDTESQSPTRSFFLFHKRAHSDRSSKTTELTATRRHRNRANTTPPRARPQPDCGVNKAEMPPRKRQVDVWGRMLGRRGR